MKCAFANILSISFIFNFKFMFCTCIIVVDLIFVDFRFDLFRIEICKIASKCEFPPSVSIKMPPCLKLDKLVIFMVRFENQHILCNPDPKNNRPIKLHVGIRPRTDMST